MKDLSKENESNNPKFDAFISPWVLPKEPIMIQIQWNKDFLFTHIKVFIPNDFEFSEGINLGRYEINENWLIIKKEWIISREENKTYPTFFSLIFKYTNLRIPKYVHFKKFNLLFFQNDILIIKKSVLSKIFRPNLKNMSKLKPITLSDNISNYNIPIDLNFYGFGNIQTQTTVDINSVEFKADSSIAERAIDNMIIKCNQNEVYKKFEINEKDVSHFTNRLKRVEKVKFTKDNFYKIFKSPKDFIIIFDFLLELFKEAKITHKTENIKLNSPIIVIPKEKFNEKIVSMKFFLFYRDLLNNEYEPIKINIPIFDLRNKIGETNIEFKIKIRHIKDLTFKDVEKVTHNG